MNKEQTEKTGFQIAFDKLQSLKEQNNLTYAETFQTKLTEDERFEIEWTLERNLEDHSKRAKAKLWLSVLRTPIESSRNKVRDYAYVLCI